MHEIQPTADDGSTNVRPVDHGSGNRTFQIDHPVDSHQQKTGHQQQDADCEQNISNHHRAADLAVLRVPHMDQTEYNERQHDQQPDDNMDQKHTQIKVILVRLFRPPLHKRHAREIHTVGSDHSQQSQHHVKHNSQFWPDGFPHDLSGRIGNSRAGGNF